MLSVIPGNSSVYLVVVTAATTQEIFNGEALGATDPALALSRNKRKIIRDLKNKSNPHGKGIEGELFYYSPYLFLKIENLINRSGLLFKKRNDEAKLPANQRYIHEIVSRDGVDMVVTMLPELASRVHQANATLHDNTYKRVFGDWKEWEVVIWDKKMNTRM